MKRLNWRLIGGVLWATTTAAQAGQTSAQSLCAQLADAARRQPDAAWVDESQSALPPLEIAGRSGDQPTALARALSSRADLRDAIGAAPGEPVGVARLHGSDDSSHRD